MKDLDEQRVCAKLFQIGKNLYGDFSLQQAYGEECLSRTQC